MSHHENRRIVEEAWEAAIAGDFDAVVAHLAPDGVVEWPQSGERMVGPAACLNVYRNYPGGSPTYRVRRITGSGDYFVVEATGDYGDGERYLMTSIVELRNGKIARQTDYWSRPFEPPGWRAGMVEPMERV